MGAINLSAYGAKSIQAVNMKYARLITCFCMLVVMAFAATTLLPATNAHAANCQALQKELKTKVRPAILRLSKEGFNLTNWFYATLKKKRVGKHSTLDEIAATQKAMLLYCVERSDKAVCIKIANGMASASKRIYELSAQWQKDNCPGSLD